MAEPEDHVGVDPSVMRLPAEPGGGGNAEQRRLDQQTGDRVHRRALAQQSVEAERERQEQRDPRQAADLPDAQQHAGEGDRHRQSLGRPQALAEQQRAEEHAEQRIDEVSEAGFEGAAGIDRPDEGEPVGPVQQCRGGQRRAEPGVRRELAPNAADAAGDGQRGGQQKC